MSDGGGYRWKEFGARIREARAGAGLTQKRLSELVGVDAHTVWCWEAGRMRPHRHNLSAIATHCGTSVAELEGRDAVEAEVIREAEASFREALDGLPVEDIETIRTFIRFVRAERHRRTRAAKAAGAAPPARADGREPGEPAPPGASRRGRVPPPSA